MTKVNVEQCPDCKLPPCKKHDQLRGMYTGGYVNLDDENECDRCKGSGGEISQNDYIDCIKCNGTGLAKRGLSESHDE